MANVRFSKPLWHLVDARNQTVGRMASQIVRVLRGKHKPTYSPNYDCGDYVVIINAAEINFTGQKRTDKRYTWHTGFPGGLKQKTVKDVLDDKPEEVKECNGLLHFCLETHSFHYLMTFTGVTKGCYGYVCEERSSEIDLEKAADIPWRDAPARGHAPSWQSFYSRVNATFFMCDGCLYSLNKFF